MCNYFIKNFATIDSKITFWCGYNSSSTLVFKGEDSDQKFPKHFLGYDLAFIINRSNYSLKALNGQQILGENKY